MVETIKSNGDRVVDTCVRDDTLNTTVTLNCTLATVSQTLVLGANVGFTSDLVVLVINLESILHVGGVVSRKDPSLATIEDPGHANNVEQRGENLDPIFESGGTCDHDFTLNDNNRGGWTEVPSKKFSPGSTKLQQIDCTNLTRKEQIVYCKDKVSRSHVVCSNTFAALMINSDQELHALSTPILQVSFLETTR
ncbi:hypothetical protein KY284_000757 [Solanum tuberosum]|nr:hypothetical protein KY284_000757 [Solanum tuberosum]